MIVYTLFLLNNKFLFRILKNICIAIHKKILKSQLLEEGKHEILSGRRPEH